MTHKFCNRTKVTNYQQFSSPVAYIVSQLNYKIDFLYSKLFKDACEGWYGYK